MTTGIPATHTTLVYIRFILLDLYFPSYNNYLVPLLIQQIGCPIFGHV